MKIPRKAPHVLIGIVLIGNLVSAIAMNFINNDISNNVNGYVVYAVETESERDIVEETEVIKTSLFTDEDIDLIALITMAEAEGESELGKRLVIDTILNRVDSEARYFPDTVYDVIYQKNAFEPVWNGRMDRCHVRSDIRELVLEEIESRTNYDVVYFTAGEYNPYGTPLFVEGNHYFSGH